MPNKFNKSMELVASDFEVSNKIKKTNGKRGLLLIYAPWCGYCQMLAPEWKTFGEKYKNDFFIKSLNADNKSSGNNLIAEKIGVEGFPTIKVVDSNGNIGKTYDGEEI